MKTQKGITLIALIITIIVMLILVGVSVSVALNTGLFKAAQGAAKNTEAERLNETKLSEGQIQLDDGTWVSLEQYANSFGGGSEVSGPKLTITGPSGLSEYAITETTTFADLITNYPDDFAFVEYNFGYGVSDSVTWKGLLFVANGSELCKDSSNVMDYAAIGTMRFTEEVNRGIGYAEGLPDDEPIWLTGYSLSISEEL